MNSREKKRLSRQLVQQAQYLEAQDGLELSVSLVTACAALLRAANGAELAVSLEKSDFMELYAQFLGLSREAEQFFQEAARRFQAQETALASQAQALSTLREKAEQQRQALSAAVQAREELETQQVKLQARLQQARDELETAQAAYTVLQDMLKQYPPEKLAAQQKANEALTEQFHAASTQLQQLQEERQRLETQLQEVQSQLEKIPSESQALLRSYEEKQALLERLRNAQETCSPARQAELQQEIDALSPVVEENQQAVQLLESRLSDLQGQYLQYDQERQILSTNVLELLQHSLGGLQTALADHEGKLETIREQADTLLRRLSACQDIRRQYRDWLEVDQTPLDAMIEALGHSEAEELRRTLDPGCVQQIRQLQSETEERLRSLDEILERCAQAVHIDQTAVDKRARR